MLAKFTSDRIGDSTTVTLPADCAREFPGCGGKLGPGTESLKLQVLWDLTTGRLLKVLLEPGRHSDARSAAVEETPPAQSLSLWDLGSFCLKRFRPWAAAGAFGIACGQPGTVVLNMEGAPFDLWFKLWKSHNRPATHAPSQSVAWQMAEFWAKLIGVILQHGLLLTMTWLDCRRSLRKAAAVLRDWITVLQEALGDVARLCDA